ncbi:uncharacterized protein N7458_007958 [Penicillium daleae]|uniref:Uncharacterized protein n=1 Tax=Penicillium daleae TaxID=63821 RepID=A0AAD6G1L4_9EURO|nr:uncharacterized protein N7458_007958 [Penicillium daleae]KAJ5444086.1 hypothetical protein N7458_007958 [Penicillium daleae]
MLSAKSAMKELVGDRSPTIHARDSYFSAPSLSTALADQELETAISCRFQGKAVNQADMHLSAPAPVPPQLGCSPVHMKPIIVADWRSDQPLGQPD